MENLGLILRSPFCFRLAKYRIAQFSSGKNGIFFGLKENQDQFTGLSLEEASPILALLSLGQDL
jgi:hypothetical protein